MLLDVCLGTRSAWKLLLLMAETPGKALTRKQIQEHTRMGNKVLVKFLLLLKKFDLIQETRLGRQYLYKMNMANSYALQLLELIKLEKRDLNNPYFVTAIILREFVYELTNLNLEKLQKIILFGSVAKHIATIESDIDVAVVLKEKDPKIELEIAAICRKIEKRFKRTIQPHIFIELEFEEMKKRKVKLAEEILKDGIRLT